MTNDTQLAKWEVKLLTAGQARWTLQAHPLPSLTLETALDTSSDTSKMPGIRSDGKLSWAQYGLHHHRSDREFTS